MRHLTYRHIAEEKLVDYTLGYLEGKEKQDVEQHLFNCEYCLSEWRSWQMILNNDAHQSVPTSELKQTVLNHIHHQFKRRKQSMMLKPAYAVIGLCIAMIILLSINVTSNDDQLANQMQHSLDRTVHLYPLESLEMDLRKLDAIQAHSMITYQELIWIHYHEHQPIVNVTEQGLHQLIDCQYIVVSRKQSYELSTDVVQLNHSPSPVQEEANVYLKCVK